MIQSITKPEFQSHFEKVFFSDESKRIDLQLTSEAHKDEQSHYKQQNLDHVIFKDQLKRVEVKDSIMEFKKNSGMHPDTYKTNYAKFIYKLH